MLSNTQTIYSNGSAGPIGLISANENSLTTVSNSWSANMSDDDIKALNASLKVNKEEF